MTELGVHTRKFLYMDIGAGEPGMKPPWVKWRKFIQTVSFEADPTRASQLKAKNNPDETIYNTALLHQSGEGTLNIPTTPSRCSMRLPNSDWLSSFQCGKMFDPIRSISIRYTNLDSLQVTPVDFIKCIVNGVELLVLEGARETLKEVIGVHVAAAFTPIWNGESPFSDIDSFMRQQGFSLWDIKKHHWKRIHGKAWGDTKGQLIYCDALYLRDPETLPEFLSKFQDPERYNKLFCAIFIGKVWGYADYCWSAVDAVSDYPQDYYLLEKSLISHFKLTRRIPKIRGRHKLAALLRRMADTIHPTNGWKWTEGELGGGLE